jgi:hypothetical protein
VPPAAAGLLNDIDHAQLPPALSPELAGGTGIEHYWTPNVVRQ